MSKTKIGVFSILAFGIMMLLIPATSIANAAEYDKYYKEKNDRYSEDDYVYESDRYSKEKDRYGKDYGYGYDNKRDDRYYDDYRSVDDRKSYDSYQEPYKKVDNKKESDRPVIIVKNKIPIPPPPPKDKDIICEDTGILVDDIRNCPQKCETGEFAGHYVMDAETQCTPELKSDKTVCEICGLMAIETTDDDPLAPEDNVVLSRAFSSGNSENGPVSNMWEVCSADDPVGEYNQVIRTVFDLDAQNPEIHEAAEDSVEVFGICLIEAGIIEGNG